MLAPLTRNRAGPGNVPQPLNTTYYVQRASAGLMISEAIQISAQGVGYPATPGIHSAAQVAGWQALNAADKVILVAGGGNYLDGSYSQTDTTNTQSTSIETIANPPLQVVTEVSPEDDPKFKFFEMN